LCEAAVAPAMRWTWAVALAAAAVVLSGCAATNSTAPQSPLLGLCPQWVQGPGGQTIGASLHGTNESHELGPANATWQGHALDAYRLQVTKLTVGAGGRLELRVFAADGRQLALRDYRQPSAGLVPVLVFTNGTAVGHEFDAFLSPVTQGGTAAPTPATLRLAADGNATVEVAVTYHYKVCGSS
jgi:hypothetical protein